MIICKEQSQCDAQVLTSRLRLTSIEITYNEKLKLPTKSIPREQDYHSLVSNIFCTCITKKLQIDDTSFETHEQFQIFEQPVSQFFYEQHSLLTMENIAKYSKIKTFNKNIGPGS